MKTILELTKIITLQKIKSLKVLNLEKAKQNKTLIYQLYNLLMSGKTKTDWEAAKELYGTDPSDPRYRQTKMLLKKRMLNTFLFINAPRETRFSRQKAKRDSRLLLAIISRAKSMGLAFIAIPLAKKVIEKTEKFELSGLCIDALSFLIEYNAILPKDHTEFLQNKEKLFAQRKIYEAEYFLKSLFHNLIYQYVDEKSDFEQMVNYARQQRKEVQSILKRVHSCDAIFYGSMILIIGLLNKKHLKQRIALCEKALERLLQKPFLLQNIIFILSTQCALFYTTNNEHKKSLELLKNTLQWALMHKEFGWLKFKQVDFATHIHAKHYSKARSVLKQVLNSSAWKNSPEEIKEIWVTNQIYLKLLKNKNFFQKSKKSSK